MHFKTLYNGNWASEKFVGIIKTCGTQEGSQRLGLDIVTLLGTSELMWHTQTEKGIFLTSLKKTLMQVLRSPTYINLKIF